MGFVQIAFLGAVVAVAIPIVVHLIHRWQVRQIELGSIRFLAEIIRENARRKRIRRWLLLAARILAVLLLALLFARPHLSATLQGDSSRLVLILIDRSASMSLKTDDERLIDHALDRARRLVAGFDEGTEWELAFFDDAVKSPTEETEDGASTVRGLKALKDAPPVTSVTSYGAAMSWARDLCIRSSHTAQDVYVLTDMQRSGLDWIVTQSFPDHVRVHVEDLGRDQVNNVAVANVDASSTLLSPGDQVVFNVSLFNHGPFPLDDLPVRLSLNSKARTLRRLETVTLAPGRGANIAFEIPSLETGLWQGTVDVDVDDDLRFDNRRHLAVLSASHRRVLVVDGRGEVGTESETWLLETALRLAPPGESFVDSPFTPETIHLTEQTRLPTLKPYDLVVLSNTGSLTQADAETLSQFVSTGGGLLVFSGENVTQDSMQPLADTGLMPGRIVGIERSRGLPFRWRDWIAAHPLFEPFADPQHGDLRRLSFSTFTRFEPSSTARVLAEFRRDAPALIEHRVGQGRVFWFTSGLSRDWGSWSRNRLFLPLVHQLLADLSGLTGGGPVRQVVVETETANADRDQAHSHRPGVHEFDGHWDVVNLGSRESETERCTVADLAERYQFTTATGEEGQAPQSPNQAADLSLRSDEIWHWVVLALLILLSGETFLANRTTS